MIHSIDSFPGRTISANGKSYVYFGGTSYLGLQNDKAFQKLFIENLKRYGTNYGASRNANVQFSIFEKAETFLANLVGSEHCTSMSSGYLAGQLVVQNMCSDTYEFFRAPESHSAIHRKGKKPYDSFIALNTEVRAHLDNNKKIPVVLLDSITVLHKTYPDFECLKALPLKNICIVADDSHGIGIVGENGKGSYEMLQKFNPKELIVCCSLGKGFGIQAGAVFGTKKRITQLQNTNFYGGASPASPAALATLLEGETLFKRKRKLLKRNINLFLNALKNIKLLNYIDDYPAFYFSNSKIADFLEENNILITNFNYPNEDSPLMSRIVLSASHTKEDIILLTKLLNSL